LLKYVCIGMYGM